MHSPPISQSNTPEPSPIAELPPVPPISGHVSPSWTIDVGEGRGQILDDEGLMDQGHSAAMVIFENAARWLQITAYLGIFFGLLSLVNGLFTLYMTSSGNVVRGSNDNLYHIVMILSVSLGLIGIGGGSGAVYSATQVRTLSNHPFKWIPLLFALFYPLTWPIGIPAALYAFWKLRNPKVAPYWT